MHIPNMIKSYLDGWRTGSSSALLAQAAEGFFLYDPNQGTIDKANFETYVAGLWVEAKEYRGDQEFDRLEDLSEIITGELDDGTVNVWFWWKLPGTPIEGSSLVKVSEAGVHSETICYYGKTDYSNLVQ